MKKLTLLLFCLVTTLSVMAQRPVRVQKSDHPMSKDVSIDFNSIRCWAGEGEHQAALVVSWGVFEDAPCYVWGFRWSGDEYVSGADMMQAISEADPNFYFDGWDIIDEIYYYSPDEMELSSVWAREFTGEYESDFWMYQLNNEMGAVGISQYELQDGDVITWAYGTLSTLGWGDPWPDFNPTPALDPNNPGLPEAVDSDISNSDIQFWVGSGSNSVRLIVSWAEPDTALAWGYRFNGSSVSVADVLDAIAAADPRLEYSTMHGDVRDILFHQGREIISGYEGAWWFMNVNGVTSTTNYDEQLLVNGDKVKFGDRESAVVLEWGDLNGERVPVRAVWTTPVTPASTTFNVYDFSAVAPNGKTLYYVITSLGNQHYTVSVSRQLGLAPYYNTKPSGDIVIPATVTYNGRTYSVTGIAEKAFYGCSNIASVHCLGDVPPSLGQNAFGGVNANTPIIVGCEAVESYENAWTYFSTFVASFDYQFSAVADNNNHGSVMMLDSPQCDNGGTAMVAAFPKSGYQFVRWSNNSTENPLSLVVNQDITLSAIFEAIVIEPVHDTVTIFDTVITTIHDTISNTLYDTVYAIQHDTITNTLYDTIFTTIHDTILDTLYDTIFTTLYDTVSITIHDTIEQQLTYYTLSVSSSNIAQGLVAGNGSFSEGTEVEIAAIPIEGSHFVRWNDNNTENPRRVTLAEDTSFEAIFEQNSTQDVADVMMQDYSIITREGMIVVKNADGEQLRVYDVTGRLMYQGRIETEEWHVGVNTVGAYFVQVANTPAQKVVVMK